MPTFQLRDKCRFISDSCHTQIQAPRTRRLTSPTSMRPDWVPPAGPVSPPGVVAISWFAFYNLKVAAKIAVGLTISPAGSGSAFQHLQHVSAREARTKKAVSINFADMSDLVTDRRDLGDSGLKPLFRIRRATEMVTSILPNFRREEQGWELAEVEVVDDAQRLRSRRACSECARKDLALAVMKPLLNFPRGRLAE